MPRATEDFYPLPRPVPDGHKCIDCVDWIRHNPFRDEIGGAPYQVDSSGCVCPLEAPGHGIQVYEAFVAAHPLIEGPCYV